ncbi:ATP-binding protein [Streptomyces sp. J2-1]|uniref:ATP-binding protein n=1 Tax=Streptomyces corallincola TaxID=2851888 RepID=UPI001C384A51|nr:ATP-binding protein [Streptomyces corallincola]MBV2356041.1 ATP-binding protein [Streptomyces corallincola]
MSDACPPPGIKKYDRYDTATYAPYPRSVPLARRNVARLTALWGQDALVADAALIAGELCANAVLHGCLRDRLFRVETSLTGGVLRITVTDPKGERLPEPRQAGADEQFGRGLLLVRAVATRWAVEKLTVGKSVWAELDTSGTVPQALNTSRLSGE